MLDILDSCKEKCISEKFILDDEHLKIYTNLVCNLNDIKNKQVNI